MQTVENEALHVVGEDANNRVKASCMCLAKAPTTALWLDFQQNTAVGIPANSKMYRAIAYNSSKFILGRRLSRGEKWLGQIPNGIAIAQQCLEFA